MAPERPPWRRRAEALVALAWLTTGCTDPCERLVDLVCREHPREALCASYRWKVDNDRISPPMCEATVDVFEASLRQRHEAATP